MKAKIETRSKICILFIFCSLIILCIKIVPSLLVNSSEQKAIIEFYNNQYDNNDYNIIEETNLLDKSSTDTKNSRYDYIATIKIPAINLERGLVSIDNTYNNVKYNIEILSSSSQDNIILAAHSGNASNAYFKDLSKLTIGDTVSLFYNNKEYKYNIVFTYDIEKTGKASLIKSTGKSILTLITCRQNTNKQIIIVCELVEIKDINGL